MLLTDNGSAPAAASAAGPLAELAARDPAGDATAPDAAPARPQRLFPHLTAARAPLVCEVPVTNEFGQVGQISIPAERDLTVYVDKRELVTLMTLGAHPEWLVLGYLLNQRLVQAVDDIESVTVDWEVGAASVKTRAGIHQIEDRTAHRVVTTGCGQGSVFGHLMDDLERIQLPPDRVLRQSHLYHMVNTIRLHDSTYKVAGSVHACALFVDGEMAFFVEDVGRHNAVDTIAGWLGMQPEPPQGDKVFYTTGRLTSEMVIKSAQMGVPVVVSRSGITQMGLQVAQRVGLCAIGRATHRRFLCYSHPQRIVLDAPPPPPPPVPAPPTVAPAAPTAPTAPAT